MTAKQILWIAVIMFGGAFLSISVDPEFTGLGAWFESISQYRTTESLLGACLIYTICIAIPFMPGVELGLLIMLVFGEQGIVAAYLSTILGLNAAFLAGRLSRAVNKERYSVIASMSSRVGAQRWKACSGKLGRLTALAKKPGGRFRYPALALLFNLPGNSIIGGGGGIALLSGMSRSFSWPQFAVTVVLATCLVPILAYIGVINIEDLVGGLAD